MPDRVDFSEILLYCFQSRCDGRRLASHCTSLLLIEIIVLQMEVGLLSLVFL